MLGNIQGGPGLEIGGTPRAIMWMIYFRGSNPAWGISEGDSIRSDAILHEGKQGSEHTHQDTHKNHGPDLL